MGKTINLVHAVSEKTLTVEFTTNGHAYAAFQDEEEAWWLGGKTAGRDFLARTQNRMNYREVQAEVACKECRNCGNESGQRDECSACEFDTLLSAMPVAS